MENQAIRTPSVGSSSEDGNTVSSDSEHPVTPENQMIRTESGTRVNFLNPLNSLIDSSSLLPNLASDSQISELSLNFDLEPIPVFKPV